MVGGEDLAFLYLLAVVMCQRDHKRGFNFEKRAPDYLDALIQSIEEKGLTYVLSSRLR